MRREAFQIIFTWREVTAQASSFFRHQTLINTATASLPHTTIHKEQVVYNIQYTTTSPYTHPQPQKTMAFSVMMKQHVL